MNRKGFTLIELLVVVAVIGVLAALGSAKSSSRNRGCFRSKFNQKGT